MGEEGLWIDTLGDTLVLGEFLALSVVSVCTKASAR